MKPNPLNYHSYRVSMTEPVGYLIQEMGNYLAWKHRHHAEWRREVWVKEFNAMGILLNIIDHVFEVHVDNGQDVDRINHALFVMRREGMDDRALAEQILHQLVNLVVQTLGSLFPDMRFGDGVRIQYDIVTGYDLMIGISDWLE